jgi:5'-3' exonuclease
MGIKGLNRYLKRQCIRSITPINIQDIENKTIVVDTSIYMYKFLEQNTLLENFFTMITEMRHYNIQLLFIFDGMPDESKMPILWERVYQRKEALQQYKTLKAEYETKTESNTLTAIEQDTILKQMEQYKKSSTRVKEKHIKKVKELLDAMNVYYMDAPMEADTFCAYFVNHDYAWACMSDDMDMLTYGCKRIIREWCITKKKGMLYDYNKLINELHIPDNQFRHVLLLLGTDYHRDMNEEEIMPVDRVFHYYNAYTKGQENQSFYSWLQEKQKITPKNKEKLEAIYLMYDLSTIDPNTIKNIHKTHPIQQYNVLQNILGKYGFIF